MKIKIILMTAFAALTFACANNKGGDGPKIPEESKASLHVAFTLPVPVGTRAEEPATSEESVIKDIYIYVFKSGNGTTPADANNGFFGPFDPNVDFTFVPATNTYEMNDPITTTAGLRNIYVAANLNDAGLNTGYSNESLFLAAVTDVHNNKLIQYSGINLDGIVMFGKRGETILAPEDEGDNEIGVNIERAVSRVITTAQNAQIKVDWAATQDMTFNIVKYFVTQDAHKSYVAPHFFDSPSDLRPRTLISGKDPLDESDWGDVLNIYDPDNYSTTALPPYVDISAPITPLAATSGFYIGENASNTPTSPARHGNTTYAYIQTKVSITNTAVVNAAQTGIEYTGPGITGGTDDLHIVRVKGVKDYICTTANKQAVSQFLADNNVGKQVFTLEYPKSFVYYRVFMNNTTDPAEADHKYNVYRNQFIHIDVTGIRVNPNDPDGFGGGNPGDKQEPEIPVDPFEPGPIKPTDPIDEEDATLLVKITVKNWEYKKYGTILE